MLISGTSRARKRRLDVRLLARHPRNKRHDVRSPESAEVWTEPLTARFRPATSPQPPTHARAGDTARVACLPPRAPWSAEPRDNLKGSTDPAKRQPATKSRRAVSRAGGDSSLASLRSRRSSRARATVVLQRATTHSPRRQTSLASLRGSPERSRGRRGGEVRGSELVPARLHVHHPDELASVQHDGLFG